ncbi:hypothetical protein [Janthinobacterium agaricidamnosum]|uniref:Thiopeptide-type bacteriocin biosynthesis domain-containing protein n=1 Tax=Janthinobacterium agaricidamnosum NBRC 102515 = DSM 9628 TaxID=1349767 RepID=W0VES4_9BURK|nr:hypothetical protein [Janthinobacterium agaricidamnosum]CDG85923.1 hypothetical protein GJA_5327 [Janthinobacterium agaricidamnosum NBRC 102515 = DSM 9628]
MKFMQLRINYTENHGRFYHELLVPLQRWLAERYFYRWNIARGWQNGPHYLLTLDAGAPFYRDAWQAALLERSNTFLQRCPSSPLDAAAHRALQVRLNTLEAAGIDPDVIEPNNTASVHMTTLEQLAAKYESPQQWRSVFDTQIRLHKAVVAHWSGADGGINERFAFELMVMLACVYPPAPSDDPEVFEYNGFLSYHSNYVFWRHGLKPEQQAIIDRRFSDGYGAAHGSYLCWLDALEADLAQAGHRSSELAQALVASFLEHCQLARDGVIHARSPFARERLADQQQVSAFHQRYFYDEDGGARAFGLEFSAYRWLLNIVYRTLPLLNISPMTRQMLNYALNRLQQEQAPAIGRIRVAMLTSGTPAAPIMKAAA